MKASKVLGKVVKAGIFLGSIGGLAYYSKKSLDKSGQLQGRYKAYYQLANQWLVNKNEGKNVATYFADNDIEKVAIYGMGTLGELLYNEIKENVKVAYFIDKNADTLYYGLDDTAVVGFDDIDSQGEVDAIIVTPIFDFDDIEKDLEDVIDTQLISLEDIVYGI